jgi:hypothetical protein
LLEQAFTSGTTNDGTPVGYGFGWFMNVFQWTAYHDLLWSGRVDWSGPRKTA